ncbi:MAG TPA: branched-chain amino acid ABC transporter permease, partial [Candidatus Thermoplasmatota archaeon]|nr:branched-chain amino acid ABC transporter permease [Candidatus Thermoplasmatota archaeon]
SGKTLEECHARRTPARAAALGKNVALYKLQALMLGSAVAALAGVLLAWHSSNVFPDDFAPIVTFYAFIVLVLGGVGNHKGAILGSVLFWGILQAAGSLTFLQRYGIEFAGPLEVIFIGVVLILVMMFRPQGAVGSKEEMVLGK